MDRTKTTVQAALVEDRVVKSGKVDSGGAASGSELKKCLETTLRRGARAPRATYRIQVNGGFPFAAARELVAYLDELGVSDLYASPIFEARPGSQHGYDVVDQNKISTEAGGEVEFDLMSNALRERQMGLLLDIVPNHMGVGSNTPWWQDVLENGQASEYSGFFDIDWHPVNQALEGKLLLPILGNSYGEELENGNIHICQKDTVHVCYFDHVLPLAPRSIPLLFAGQNQSELPEELDRLLKELEHVPPHDTDDETLAEQRRSQLKLLLPRLRKVLASEKVAPVLARAIKRVNGIKGQANSFDQLHTILEAQPYRLAHWRVSGEEINYRRFFDVNELVGLRMENPRVFSETHKLLRRLLGEQRVQGVRIDHCDGLFDPRQYLIRLQKLVVAALCCGPEPHGELAANGIEQPVRSLLYGISWDPTQVAVYTLVEKILEPKEQLPSSWPVSGTSGYDFIHQVNNLFIQSANEKRFTQLYARFQPEGESAADVIYRSKLLIANTALASEVHVLTNLLHKMGVADRRARDFTQKVLATVIRETIACMPVYRTYIDDRGRYSDQDRALIRYAISLAKRRNPGVAAQAFDFLRETLLLGGKEGVSEETLWKQQLFFALKFQQLSGPVMAKGVEDTSFYVYNRFVSSNEVGGSLLSFGSHPADFHKENLSRSKNFPSAMLASSTHDTKRSEDVRARLNVLSEMPRQWSGAVQAWSRLNRRHKQTLEDGRVVPDGNEEYLIYQTLAGTWPWRFDDAAAQQTYIERIQQYMNKAINEAKVNVSWVNPDPAYSGALEQFIARILSLDESRRSFVSEAERLLPQVRYFGAINALAQLVLKMMSPGVPDFYQGTELWDFSLVDPDNRRAVDYKCRKQRLADLKQRAQQLESLAPLCREILSKFEDGRIKLWVTHRGLTLRRDHEAIFAHGSYEPLNAEGEKAEHAVVFLRQTNEKALLTVVPRFAWTLMRGSIAPPLAEAWGDTTLKLPHDAPGRWRNAFTGELLAVNQDGKLMMKDVFRLFPVAAMVGEN